LLAVLLGIPALACRATGADDPGVPMPFHVALVPTEVLVESAEVPAQAAEAAPREGGFRLELRDDEVSRSLTDELQRAFVRATLLAPPADAGAFAALTPREREEHWQAEARAVGANLLLRSRLIHEVRISGRRNERFWLNLPLFFLGGPFCYFVGDRSYEASARLQAEFFEVTAGRGELEEHSLLAIPLYAEHEGFDLNFLERAPGPGSYLVSLVVPAGLLARENSKIEATLAERLPHALGQELVRKAEQARVQFELNPDLCDLALDVDRTTLVRAADGSVRVHAPLLALGPGSTLLRYEVLAGEAVLARRTPPAGGASQVEDVDLTLALPPEERFLSLRLYDGAANVRSYTLRVPGEDG
jgi:hypothetical protein